jgi:ribosomal protein S15P/S13E
VEEKERFLEKLIASIDEESWFLLFLIDYRGHQNTITTEVLKTARSFLTKTTVAEYSALIMGELLTIAEHAQLKNLAERDNYLRTHPDELEGRLADPEFRAKLADRAQMTGELMNVSYHFETYPYDPKARSSVTIRIKNRGLLGYRSRNDVLQKRRRMLRRENLSDLVSQDQERALGANLLEVYLDAIVDAAATEGANIETEVIRDENKDETTTILTLSL